MRGARKNERNNLQKERRLSDTQHRIDRSEGEQRPESTGQIRQDEKTISSGTQETIIPLPTPIGETVSPPVGDRQDSEQADGANNDRCFAESTDPTGQDDRPDGMGGLHEQSESTGRGNDTGGAYIQLTLFPTEQETDTKDSGEGKD